MTIVIPELALYLLAPLYCISVGMDVWKNILTRRLAKSHEGARWRFVNNGPSEFKPVAVPPEEGEE